MLLWLDSVSFRFDDQSVREDEAETYIWLDLFEPATSDRVIQVYSYRSGDNATGKLYTTGHWSSGLVHVIKVFITKDLE